jgi:hypothetical protein
MKFTTTFILGALACKHSKHEFKLGQAKLVLGSFHATYHLEA